jgi:hypothetical protein
MFLYNLIGRIPKNDSLKDYFSSLHIRRNEENAAKLISFFIREHTKLSHEGYSNIPTKWAKFFK